MANLMAMNFSDSGLNLVLSAHLDTLAISPQTKQVIILALLRIVKFGDVYAQAQRCVHTICSYSFCLWILINCSQFQYCSAATGKVQLHTPVS